jgi:hypothetical protein
MEQLLLATDLKAVAWMYSGQWVADCPRPTCFNVEKRGQCDDRTTGGLTADQFYCRPSHGGCGVRCAVEWPYRITEIEKLVLARPFKDNQNWRPGEDLLDLLGENLQHGIIPTEALEGGPSRKLLAIIDDEVQSGQLESVFRPEIESRD